MAGMPCLIGYAGLLVGQTMSCRDSEKYTGARETGQASISMSRGSMGESYWFHPAEARVVEINQQSAIATATPTTCWTRLHCAMLPSMTAMPMAVITNQ